MAKSIALSSASQADLIIKRMFKESLEADAQARKDETALRLNFYHDAQEERLREVIGNKFSEINPHRWTLITLNIVKKIINQLAMVYLKDAKREVQGSDEDKQIFEEIARMCNLGATMKLASRYTKLLKTVLLRPVWREGRMDLDILTGNLLDVQIGDTPRDLQAVLVTRYPESGRYDEINYALWTPERITTLDYRGYEVGSERNPYGRLTFVPLWDRVPNSDFWLVGGDDLITAQEALNKQLVYLLRTIEMQGFGILWLKGVDGGNMLLDPGAAIRISAADGEAGFIQPDAPIADVVAALEWLMKTTAMTNGLSAASLTTEVKDESGVSKIVGNRELEEMRRDDVALFEGYEKQVFEAIRVVWNAHNPGRKISAAAELKVDFYDPKQVVSAVEQCDEWESLIHLGAISLVDVAMQRNPDLKTREDALAYLKQVRDEQAELANHEMLEDEMRLQQELAEDEDDDDDGDDGDE
jgi:hypothetical protein